MGDSIEDPFDNSDAEDQEIEKPRTPDYHDGRQEEQEDIEAFSDISDERGNEKHEEEDSKESSVQAVVDSPDSEVMVGSPEEKDEEERKDIREHVDEEELSPVSSGVTETSPKKDTEDSKDGEEKNGEEEERDDEITEEKFVDENPKSESEESVEKEERGSHDGSPDDPNSTSQKMSEEPSDISRDGPKDGNDEDEDLEMPLSPIGDLGLSEPEAAIVDDILKGDVSEMMPGHKVEVSQGEDNGGIKSAGDDDDEETSIKETEEEAKSPQEADDDEGVNVNKPNSEEVDDQDEERSEPEEAGEQLIADIFGASDEEEEFEGFDQEDIDLSKAKQGGSKKTSKPMISDDDDDDDDVNDNEVTGQVTDSMVVPKPKVNKEKQIDSDEDDGSYRGQVWDFDVMMEQKKASRSKRRRKNDGDLISDNDDLVVEMIKKMQEAAEEDKMLNEAKQAATKKLKLLPLILKHLNKADLQFTFIDSGILNGIKEWLSPLPDGSLPHLQIRTGLLKILSAFPALDTGALKMSGLGKAVMYIYRHPKEIRQNKDMAGKLINEWARPIFGVTSNFKSMSREEREERDYQNMSKRRRLSSTDEGSRTPRSIDKAIQGEKKAARPGEKGFIMRARVPTPSNKDYVVRPKSNLDTIEFQRNSPKVLSRADKQMRKFKDRNKAKNASRITISIEGRKMGL